MKPYPDGAAVEAAIKQAALLANASAARRGVDSLIRQTHFDRFLCRVFSSASADTWLLKGGTGVLARVPDARTTRDIDLQRSVGNIDQAAEEIRRLADEDLGDHFSFTYHRRALITAGDAQPYLQGCRLSFRVQIGVKQVGTLSVDLVAGHAPVGPVRSSNPANRLHLPRLRSVPYRLFPTEDQIADKVCATVGPYPGGPSSREKDLVDLVVLSRTASDLDMRSLRRALRVESARRGQTWLTQFSVPPGWGRGYRQLAAGVPLCSEMLDVSTAAAFVAAMLDPVLNSEDGGIWDPTERRWRSENLA